MKPTDSIHFHSCITKPSFHVCIVLVNRSIRCYTFIPHTNQFDLLPLISFALTHHTYAYSSRHKMYCNFQPAGSSFLFVLFAYLYSHRAFPSICAVKHVTGIPSMFPGISRALFVPVITRKDFGVLLKIRPAVFNLHIGSTISVYKASYNF